MMNAASAVGISTDIRSIIYAYDGRIPTEKAAGYQSVQMCRALGEQGCAIKLVVSGRRWRHAEGMKLVESVEAYYGLDEPLPHSRLRNPDFLYWIDRLLPSVIARRLAGLASRLGQLTFSALLSRVHCVRQADAVFVRQPQLLYGLDLFASRAVLAQAFCELHTLPRTRAGRALLRRSGRRCAGFVALTGPLRDRLIDEGIAPERVIVAHDAVDLSVFARPVARDAARADFDLTDASTIALYAGRFETMGEEKGIPDIITAAPLVLDRVPDLTFVFVGGPKEAALRYVRQIEAQGLPRESFVFIDHQPRERVAVLQRAADILLMPFPWHEHYAYYMSPLKMFEYMAAGRAIVATDLPSVSDVLQDGVNASLARPGDAASIAAAIVNLAENPELAARLGQRAARDVREYTWDVRARRILEFMARRLAASRS